GRMLACAAEEHHDERGLSLPISIAPYAVALISVGGEEEVVGLADSVYRELSAQGVEVLYDDRDLSPGVKFADADLRGMPLRVTVSPRALRSGGAEFKRRSGEPFIVSRDRVTAAVLEELRLLEEELERWVGAQMAPVEQLVATTLGGARSDV
ncbi:prolyl-tRNA synthetase, partial [mine drainage metagenome]